MTPKFHCATTEFISLLCYVAFGLAVALLHFNLRLGPKLREQSLFGALTE